jgi:hypothetical protein
MVSNKKPFIVTAAASLGGHVVPIRAVAANLVERGYDVTMVTGSAYRESIEALGITFEPFIGYADFIDPDINKWFPERSNYDGPARIMWDLEHIFTYSIPSQHEALQRVFRQKKE